MRRSIATGALITMVAAVAVGSAAGVAAQSTSDPTNAPAHPAHIHSGNCADLGDVAAPLTDVTIIDGREPRILGSVTTVDLTLADILATPHAIMAHKSAAGISSYIACADLVGTQTGETLVVALRPQQDSGFLGLAFLEPSADATDVYLSLTAPEASAPVAALVDIFDFDFGPSTLTVPSGTMVTWTNSGPSAHTVTSDDGAFEGDTLLHDEVLSVVFDSPGTFDYHCAIHPEMQGRVTVE